ncbi:hypothetical protein [Actinacidiphila acidipaludis]|uniref:Uncharacterized protein n=1 Tax=Actinacidiphila acidipaludis TaxID=2873382 RepID=A0ABS7QHS6_9ACTN|nr:hypothetical protein [Streptomyces acidipaludis]MBY8882717.1 hypothetical protein [Streptomyces acidipaludis]
MDLESRLRLEDDVPAVEEFLAEAAGHLHHRGQDDPGLFWAEVRPRQGGLSPFVVRIHWTVYPGRPPSVIFVEAIGAGPGGPGAWPAAGGYRPSPGDVCKPFTAEGQQLHAEWAVGPHAWRGTGNPFLYVLHNIQDDIDRENGRRAA